MTACMTACMQHLYQNEESGNPQRTVPLVEIVSNKLLKYYSNAFKKDWNNTGIICLNIIVQTWDMFSHTGLTELHIFFLTRSTTFFSSNVFVISMLVFFLIRR